MALVPLGMTGDAQAGDAMILVDFHAAHTGLTTAGGRFSYSGPTAARPRIGTSLAQYRLTRCAGHSI